jgi:hypothetical protein
LKQLRTPINTLDKKFVNSSKSTKIYALLSLTFNLHTLLF